MLRAFFKNITNLNGEMLGSAELKVNSGTISDDLLSKATSSFELVSIPPVIENGNVIGIYDEYGQILFTGIINSVEGQSVTASNILAIFDDVWRYYDPALNTTIEDCIEDILIRDYKNSSDTLVSTIFNQFTLQKISSTSGNLGLMGNNYTVNMYDYIMSLYNTYDILLDIYIPPSNGQSIIRIGKPTFGTIKIGNNTNAIKNIQITKEVQETNRLVIYDGYGLLRGIWYATPSGITQDASALDRITKVKSEIVFSDLPDAELSTIVAEHLSDKIYNHKITCELLIKNSLYNYKDFTLGTNIQVFFDGEYYDSVLTGYSYGFDNRGVLEYMTLTMGKVRYSLADKLKIQKQEIGQIQNVQNYQVYVKQYVDREIGEISSTVASVEESTSTITNMLYDTNAPSLAKVYGPNDRYFSSVNNASYIECTYISIDDAPRPTINYGVNINVIQTIPSGRVRAIAWPNLTLTAGTTYTVSCYARVSTANTGGNIGVYFCYGANPYADAGYSETYYATSTDWTRFSWTFTADSTYFNESGKTLIYVGMFALSGTTAGGIDICNYFLQTGEPSGIDTKGSAIYQLPSDLAVLNGNVSDNTEQIQRVESHVNTVQQTAEGNTRTISAVREDIGNNYWTITETQTKINEKADSITTTFSNSVTNAITGEKQRVDTMIRESGDGIAIGKSGNKIEGRFDNDSLDFVDTQDNDKKLAWVDANEGLGGSALAVGDPSNIGNRWRIFTRQSGTHLTFTRHS